MRRLLVVMGCNSGGRDPEKVFLSEMVNLGKGFLEVFVSFGDMITGTLGIKAETKKSEIGGYFTKIAETMKEVRGKLGKILEENGHYAKVKEKVGEFITTIDKIEEGAKTAAGGISVDDKISAASAAGQDAAPADKDSVNFLVNGIKTIVAVVLRANEGDATATKTADTEKKSVGKLFSGTNAADGTDAHAAAASASIGAVSGADILQAIAKSANVADNEIQIVNAKNAAEIAAAKKENAGTEFNVDDAKKDAVIAAGIALRAMSKGGKFAAKNENKSAHAVNGVAASAVTKVLNTLIISIKNTVDSGLKEVSEVLATIKQEDKASAKVAASGQQ
ncbi:Variable outer membrane protein (plasmid) [Borrelia crocidurae DOU]|uniref:Variable large protein n=1 Tax=Borrelia crocidurae DOU TaxID=1293575 RepID=W5SMF3_9SPIR|nr:variable large family protein [Borrelia crocidurae]AHH07828.1 Variable outer membrane protein [Borrelia crocidurae DOU]